VHRFVEEHQAALVAAAAKADDIEPSALDEALYVRHRSVKGATQDIDRFQFNTALSRHMELTNALYALAAKVPPARWGRRAQAIVADWVRVLAPLAPHLGEELWRMSGGRGGVFEQAWPTWDEAALQRDEITVVVQVNGKVREQMPVARGTDDEQLSRLAQAFGKVPSWTAGKRVVKVVVVPDKLVNIVVA
jgi:leucyl-tRNA synthetase